MFKILDEIRKTTMETEKCRNPIQTEGSWKKTRQKIDVRVGVILRGKILQRPVVKKLWVVGRSQ